MDDDAMEADGSQGLGCIDAALLLLLPNDSSDFIPLVTLPEVDGRLAPGPGGIEDLSGDPDVLPVDVDLPIAVETGGGGEARGEVTEDIEFDRLIAALTLPTAAVVTLPCVEERGLAGVEAPADLVRSLIAGASWSESTDGEA